MSTPVPATPAPSRDAAVHATRATLNAIMEFGVPLYSHGDGTVTPATRDDVRWPEMVVYLRLDDDGQSTDDVPLEPLPDGWEFLTGWTGQYGYSGMMMHPSEYVGGGLARHILETPGYYVTVLVDGIRDDVDAESESIGWAIAYCE